LPTTFKSAFGALPRRRSDPLFWVRACVRERIDDDAFSRFARAQVSRPEALPSQPTRWASLLLMRATGDPCCAQKLVELHRAGRLSFENVVTVNMDEYVGLEKGHEQSYHRFMWDNLFSHIDIRPENVHILDGMAEDLQAECDKVSQLPTTGLVLTNVCAVRGDD
jgi:hypothetical protein